MAETKKRKVHSAEFKAKVVLEAVRGIKTVLNLFGCRVRTLRRSRPDKPLGIDLQIVGRAVVGLNANRYRYLRHLDPLQGENDSHPCASGGDGATVEYHGHGERLGSWRDVESIGKLTPASDSDRLVFH